MCHREICRTSDTEGMDKFLATKHNIMGSYQKLLEILQSRLRDCDKWIDQHNHQLKVTEMRIIDLLRQSLPLPADASIEFHNIFHEDGGDCTEVCINVNDNAVSFSIISNGRDLYFSSEVNTRFNNNDMDLLAELYSSRHIQDFKGLLHNFSIIKDKEYRINCYKREKYEVNEYISQLKKLKQLVNDVQNVVNTIKQLQEKDKNLWVRARELGYDNRFPLIKKYYFYISYKGYFQLEPDENGNWLKIMGGFEYRNTIHYGNDPDDIYYININSISFNGRDISREWTDIHGSTHKRKYDFFDENILDKYAEEIMDEHSETSLNSPVSLTRKFQHL